MRERVGEGGRGKSALLFLSGLMVVLLTVPAGAFGAAPTALWQRCDGSLGELSCSLPRGIGVSPTNGHLYVAEGANTGNRIDEYTAWGEFMRSWGWGVADGAEELQVCTVAPACKNGIAGGGRGELTAPQGVAVDPAGNVYVAEGGLNNGRRVQKFDSEGHFILMFGAKVNKTKVEEGKLPKEQNVCPVDPADVCQAAVEGSGPGEFGPIVLGGYIATGTTSNNVVYVGDKAGGKGRVQVFNPDGSFKEFFPDPDEIIAKEGGVQSLVPGPAKGLFLTFKEKADVILLTSAGNKSCTVNTANPTAPLKTPTALAIAATSEGKPSGSLYVYDESSKDVRQFNANNCREKETISGEREPPFAKGEVSASTGLAAGIACLGKGADVYLSNSVQDNGNVRAYGPAPDKAACTKPHFAPVILAQYAVSVGTVEAVLGTRVNPRFYADTTFQLQYGTAACIDAGGWTAPCVTSKPSAPASLGAEAVDFPFNSPLVEIDGLSPATRYSYRFIAESDGSKVLVEGPRQNFTTFAIPVGQKPCPNEAFRGGEGALLPDCRAYELVSPLDKEGGQILTLGDVLSFARPAALDRSSSSGDSFTYSSYTPFAGAQSAPFTSQYLGRRQAGVGWLSEAIAPPRGTNFIPAGGASTFPGSEAQFEAFSEDLCSAWLRPDNTTGPALGPGGVAFNRNYYRRQNCGSAAGTYTGLSRVGAASPTRLQGVTPDGARILFRTDLHLSQAQANAVGTELNCQSPTPVAVSYQWLADGVQIVGATGPSYTAKPADAGKSIQCRLRASGGDGGTVADATPVFVIAPYPATAPPLAPQGLPAPTASGALSVGGAGGQSLRCDPDAADWEGSPGFAYQWYRNGVALGGATAVEYSLQPADLASAASFQCEVLASNAGGTVAAVSEAIATTPGPGAPVARANMATPFRPMVYESDGEGGVEAVCILPGSGLQANSCTAGTANLLDSTASATVRGVLSADGSRVFWTDSSSGGEGKIYARIDGKTTVKVSEAATSGPARFWTASPDGSRAIVSSANTGTLYEIDLSEPGAPAARTITAGFAGVVGASEDASLLYFVSSKALAGAAQEGQPNLYLRRKSNGGEVLSFVGTLAAADIPATGTGFTGLSPVAVEPYEHAARTSADGSQLAFMSRASLTGYDNRDSVSGEADAEVFVYDAASGRLACASCKPSGGRPAGRVVETDREPLPTAAQLPPIGSQLYTSHVLAEDGRRLFFESVDPLVLGDSNGKIDVYEWEAPGAGSCNQAAPGYSAENEGCVNLISSGKSTTDSTLLDASPSGRDVFFTTGASLLSYDPGSVDLYDAREGGGLPPPPTARPPCEGEACQSPAPPPAELIPASAAFQGAVNPKHKKRCAKGRRRVVRKGKARCLKVHKHHKQRPHKRRRAAR